MIKNINCPEDICPNCWGHQNYDGQLREKLKDEQIDINNHQKVQTFIRAFVTEHLDGIHLKNVDGRRICKACGSQKH